MLNIGGHSNIHCVYNVKRKVFSFNKQFLRVKDADAVVGAILL